VTTTTICGTDVHILKGEYPVARGLTVGHEPVGVIEELGEAVTGSEIGQRRWRSRLAALRDVQIGPRDDRHTKRSRTFAAI
jgi:NADPH:quinone reductase-like Zn-dependent oxidoreductase